jgi:hypothetical protein
MTYDDWKLETPEEEDYRLGAAGRKRRKRAEYEEEHADDLREEEHLRRQDTEYWHDVNAHHAPGKHSSLTRQPQPARLTRNEVKENGTARIRPVLHWMVGLSVCPG